ncbi:MAG TPA: PDZ domain-containing protein, partial [Clostridia bacterium]|nr:PDZ domain-containing protein [Clostridia bacterium]
MFPFAAIAWLLVQALPYFLFDIFFWLIIIFINFQYKNMVKTEIQLFGTRRLSARRLTLMSTLIGMLAGFLGSFIMIVLGVSVSNTGFGFVWIVALALALINVRFVCFAYAGGLVALFSLIFGIPQVAVPDLMALVAILHLMESILILVSGHHFALPVYVEHENSKNEDSKLVGGFSLQKFWPIPLIVLGATIIPKPENMAQLITMPDWWPLIKPRVDLLPGQEYLYQMFPLVAALGYGDLSITSQPKQKSRKTALHLAGFSLLLLALAVASSHFYPLCFLAALFAPIGHELVIWYGLKSEWGGKPIYGKEDRGVKVLDVIENTTAAQFGFNPGDLILRVNNQEVNTGFELEEALRSAAGYLWFDVRDFQGNEKQYEGWYREFELKKFGLLLAPEGGERFYMKIQKTPPWKVLWQKFRTRFFPGGMNKSGKI